MKGKPFALIGVNGNDYAPRKLKQVMDKEKLNWRTIADHGSISAKWASRGTPTYYLIDAAGTIRQKWVGNPGSNAIDLAVEKLIEAARGSSKPK